MASKKSTNPLASIVIRTFNEEKHLGALLHSIQSQDFQDFEIVVVDSGSTDETLAVAKGYPVRIEHIEPEDFTFGRSLNYGIKAARGAIVVIASAHILPKSVDWLTRLIAPFADPKVALSYGKQRGGEGSKFSEDQHWRHWFPDQSDLDQEQSFCNNANSALQKAIWRKFPFDEQLTGLEDIAWASRAKEQGFKIAYIAEAEVAHLHDESPEQIINRHRREAIALKQILPKSEFSFWNFVTLFLRKSISDLRLALAQGVFFREALGIFTFRFRQYLGTYRGYNEPGTLDKESMQAFYYPPTDLEPREKNDVESLGEAR